MKKIYEEIKFELIVLSTLDILTVSENAKDDVADDIFAPNN